MKIEKFASKTFVEWLFVCLVVLMAVVMVVVVVVFVVVLLAAAAANAEDAVLNLILVGFAFGVVCLKTDLQHTIA